MTPYQQAEARFARLGALREASAVLGWDNSAMMPAGGADARQAQIAALELVCHEMLTAPDLPDLFGHADQQNDLDTWQRANLVEMRRSWRHATALPADLLEAQVRLGLECEMIWREARPANDYAGILPSFREILRITREVAAAKADMLGVSPYDALLDQFEPEGRSADIDRLFGDLEAFLPDTIAAILDRQAAETPPLPLEGPFPIEAQREVGARFMAALGFDFDHGRLDVSLHPFCGGTPDDVRITTRYSVADFSRALMGVLHETGHALYERGLPASWRRQPVGSARGMSLHESQSLLMEMQACRSPQFLSFAAPILREAFGGAGPAWEAGNLARLYTRVARSLIRVDADEATYPAHVILRYRLERAMVAGDLDPADLPGAWREGMRRLVGIEPVDDADGCLQDIHWYAGSFGYFPTYTMGALTAAQLFETARAADPAIMPAITVGNFKPLVAWLRLHVHDRGSSVSAAEIVIDATGKPLGVEAFRRHLTARYLGDR